MTALSASASPASFSSTRVRAATRRRRDPRWHWSLFTIAVVALLLTAWGVGGSMSEYYASIALSMSRSWPNFFFGSFDPAGTVTLDKIPGSFWIPALAVRIFGYSPATVIIPNALAAAAAAVVTAVTARRWAGKAAGIVAGIVVATTPILVAVARSNQPETFFVLALSLTAWAATHALRRASLGWLILAGLFIAAGFQTYMLEAWAVWPALAAAYLCTRLPWARRVWHLGVAGVVSLGASLAWVIAVSLVPASSRPYVGSTLSNNPWEMVFGYNGLGRFGSSTADTGAYRSFTPMFSGDPSLVRLLNASLADQIGWPIPVAIVAIVLLIVLRLRRPLLVFGAVWFLTFAAMFSLVAGMHQFYTASLAIPMALLIGAAFARARRRRMLWPQLALPLTAAVTALAISLSVASERDAGFSLPVSIAQLVVAGVAVVLLLLEHRRGAPRRLTAAVSVVAMLLTPAAWSVVTVWSPNSINPTAAGVASMSGFGGLARGGAPGWSTPGSSTPGGATNGTGGSGAFAHRGDGGLSRSGSADAAPSRGDAGGPGPFGAGGMGGAGGPGRGDSAASASTVAWLTEHQQGTTYLAATFGAQSAATLILASDGGSFLPIGGFDERDPAPTLAAFQQLVADGDLRYVLAGNGAGGFGASGGGLTGTDAVTTAAGQIRTWVLATCTEVTGSPVSGLYSCGG
ncbi:ArnT family glycosyltransferase [Microbacterium sp. VKM Ac-2870]|uniref:ArnT family glycosyltransferase n=1 Tax=Microbacterium sp. VKM Ac-2870 TaxID=2783825 RepID=UPI002B266627|nr:glycosyltransferase family 39 protein [Microbacterium sp. VKM Ac-2870]